MKAKVFILFILLVATAAGAGCSSTPPAYSGVPMSSQMEPNAFYPQAMTYRNPSVDIRVYRKVMLLPVDIYTGEDAEFKGVSEEERQEMAGYLHSDMEEVLKGKGLLAPQPGPGVVSLKLILAGLEKTRPVASTLAHALPVGLVLNLGKGAMGKNGSFMGTATVGGEFTDSTNGTLIASFLVKESPNAMDISALVSPWDASKKAIDKVAQGIGDRLEKIEGGQR